jgi:hypothetical protein
MMDSPLLIEEDNLSVAWGKAFLQVMHAGEIAPLVVVIKNLENREPPEVPSIRDTLDQALAAAGKASCHTVGNTIFPWNMWNPEVDRHELYTRYRRLLPRIRKYKGNRYGVYFDRMIAFGQDGNGEGGVNQLEHIIETWRGGNHRRTALKASIFDPHRDHTNQRQRGFPCLQEVGFARHGKDGLAVIGFYVTQYMFERAYGNYLGLCRLGLFIAHELGLRLAKVTCVASPAVRDGSKSGLNWLAEEVRTAMAKPSSNQAEFASPS